MAVRKKGKAVKILFALVVVTCIVIIAAVSWKSGKDTLYGDFMNDKKVSAEILYSDVSGYDFEKNYPKTPDEVMQIYGKCYRLLYGDMIRNEDIFAEVIHTQRKLYSDELASKNVFEVQLENFKESLEKLREKDVFVVDFETKAPLYDSEFNTCQVRTIISTNANREDGLPLKAYMSFNIVRDDKGFWKIHSFKNTDSNFE